MNSAVNYVRTTGTDQRLVAASPHRVTLVIGQPSAGTGRVAPDAAIGPGEGLLISASFQPLVFTKQFHGDLATREWRLLASAAGNTVTVLEVFEG